MISDTATEAVSWAQVIVLSIVQGLTEFLPVSSSGHLRIVSELFWGNDAGASFTAVIQLGTELAVLVYFAPMIWQILSGWLRGWTNPASRGQDWRMGWMVIAGSIPIGVIGLVFEDAIRGALRNHLQIFQLQDRNRNLRPVFQEQPGHAQFLGDNTSTQHGRPLRP